MLYHLLILIIVKTLGKLFGKTSCPSIYSGHALSISLRKRPPASEVICPPLNGDITFLPLNS